MVLPLLALAPLAGRALAGMARVGASLGKRGKGMRMLSQNSKGIQVSLPRTNHGYLIEYNRAEMDRMMEDLQEDVIKKTREQLAVDDINFTSELSRSITAEKIGNQHWVVVKSPYAKFVEFGTPAGAKVNFDALRNWVEGKLGVSKDESDVVTMKIMNKIKKKGIKPKRFFKKGIKAVISQRGVLRTAGTKRSIGRVEKFLNRGVKVSKKVNKASKRIAKHISKFNKITSVGKRK